MESNTSELTFGYMVIKTSIFISMFIILSALIRYIPDEIAQGDLEKLAPNQSGHPCYRSSSVIGGQTQ